MFWRRRKGSEDRPKALSGNAYQGLRRQILELVPAEAGFNPAPEGRVVYGAIMDWPVAGAVATVVALADGTASLYLSGGGGIIGGGPHPAVAQAARTFLLSLENYLEAMVEDDHEGRLPPVGMTDLRALTTTGRRVVRASTTDLGEFRHPLANAFHAGQNLLGALRQVAESQGSRP
ncbi:MAG: hypothetical protein ACHQXA_10745 [Gemmatimonadales bacterium]